MLQAGVVAGEVPGEVELSTQAKGDIGDEVDKLVDVVQGRVLSTRQLQHQPQVQGYAVHLHEEGDHGPRDEQVSVEGVQETPYYLKSKYTNS